LVWKIEKIYPDYYFGHLLTVPVAFYFVINIIRLYSIVYLLTCKIYVNYQGKAVGI